MAMTALAPLRLERIVVIDMSPVAYNVRRHDKILQPLKLSLKLTSHNVQKLLLLCALLLRKTALSNFCLNHLKKVNGYLIYPQSNRLTILLVGKEVPAWHHPVLFIRSGLSPYI